MGVTLSTEEKREIAGRARRLPERLAGPSNEAGDDPPFDPDGLVEEWEAHFPDREAFEARLARDGLAPSELRRQVCATRWPSDRPLPDWIDELSALLDHVDRASPDGPGTASVPEGTAFGELLGPLAGHARERLDDDALPDCGIAGFEEWLVSRLETVCLQALYVEFKSFVEYHDPELADADPGAASDPPTERYEAFVDAMLGEGFRNLCLEYPVLARLLVRVLDDWTGTVRTVLERLRGDRAALADRFGVGGEVRGFEPLAEDAHAGGQFPVLVTFETGAAVYKPRPVGMGATLARTLDRLDDHLAVAAPDPPSYLLRDGYGWMERVDHRNPDDERALERYYERAGVLLCVAYVLGLTDCHHENLVVDGEHPTVVDAETALRPRLGPVAVPGETAVAATVFDSVLGTGLLPWTVADDAGRVAGHGGTGGSATARLAGLGGRGRRVELSASRSTVEAVNTDVMSVVEEPVSVTPAENTPAVDGAPRPAADHADAVVRGFEEAYRTVRHLHDRGEFLPADPAAFAGDEHRVIYRPTSRYAAVLQAATSRDCLRDGVRLSVAFERLAVPFFDGRVESGRYWPLYAAERRALARFDVPRFGARPDSTALLHDGDPTGARTRAAGVDGLRDRLDAMGPADRRRQVGFVRRAFGSAVADGPPPAPDGPPTDERLRRTAAEFCDAVVDAGVECGSGVEWVSAIGAGPDRPLQVLPADDSLYNGRAGIGLALAAASEALDRDRFRRWAVAALDPVARADPPRAPGGTTGVGSAVYALSVAADLLDRPAYADAATRHALGVTREALDADETFDLTAGTAGTLLGVLAHHERRGESAVLDRAVACGDHLLDAAVVERGHRAWRTIGDVAIPGLAHGVTGIGYALARLGAATGDDRYREAARDALGYASTLYDPDRSNYRNPMESGEDRYRDRWCYGRAGCELARIGAGTALGDDRLVRDAAASLSATAAADPSHRDWLCCGNFGRVAALIEAARRGDRDADDARRLAARCLARRDKGGSVSMPGHGPAIPNPTFFSGASGAAYVLLRLASPETLPCVALLE